MYRCVGGYACEGQMVILGVILQVPIFCETYLHGPGAHHKDLASWTVSLRDNIVSDLSVVGLALATQAAFFFLWFLETQFRPICLQGKH